MKIKKVLVLTTAEQQKIEDFGNLIKEICDTAERTFCSPDCIFKNFCSYKKDISDNFLESVEEEFDCNVNMNFED